MGIDELEYWAAAATEYSHAATVLPTIKGAHIAAVVLDCTMLSEGSAMALPENSATDPCAAAAKSERLNRIA